MREANSGVQLPRIWVLATGGTIAGSATPGAKTRYTAGVLEPEALVAAVPGIDRIATLQTEQVASVGSQNMTHDVWCTLAQKVRTLSQRDDVDGIVITHGTDTLEETAYFLSLVSSSEKPIVLVGAMRPASALSADGPGNLARAIALAGSSVASGRGPLVIMNDTIHSARNIQKIRSSGLEAFGSPARGPVGIMLGLTPQFYDRPSPFSAPFQNLDLSGNDLPDVAIVYAHAGVDGRLIDCAASWAAGIVLAGVGEGNATDLAWAALQAAQKRGVAVVRASRCAAGFVARNGEVDDMQLGTVAAGDLNAPKARILLMLALTQTRDPGLIQKFFEEF